MQRIVIKLTVKYLGNMTKYSTHKQKRGHNMKNTKQENIY